MKKIVILFFKLAVISAILFYLFYSDKLNRGHLVEALKARNLVFFIISGIFFFISQFLAALRLRLLLKTIDIPVSIKKTFQLTMMGNFFSMIAIGMTGGDIVKGLYLLKRETNHKGKSLGVIVMDRILGLFSLVFLACIFTVYMLYYQVSTAMGAQNVVFVKVAAVLGALLFILAALLILSAHQGTRKKLKQFWFAWFSRNFVYHMAAGFGGMLRYRRTITTVFLLSVIIQLLSLASVLVFGALIVEKLPPLIVQAAVSSVVLLVGSIPVTPGNIGWTELVGALGWTAVGSGAGGAIFLYRRIANTLCSLTGGLFYISAQHDSRQS